MMGIVLYENYSGEEWVCDSFTEIMKTRMKFLLVELEGQGRFCEAWWGKTPWELIGGLKLVIEVLNVVEYWGAEIICKSEV